jgi:hypothetical protein
LTNPAADHDNIIPFPAVEGAGQALRLRVDLLLMPAPVWRRFLLPAQASFWDLHVAIQDTFGWEDRHLHQFTVDDHRAGGHCRLGIPGDQRLDGPGRVLPGWEHRVLSYPRPDTPSSLYTYDFGDEWQHEVTLEAVQGGEEPSRLPRCLAGEGQAPAEDSGGPPAVDVACVLAGGSFQPSAVVFSDPRRRWHRIFDND